MNQNVRKIMRFLIYEMEKYLFFACRQTLRCLLRIISFSSNKCDGNIYMQKSNERNTNKNIRAIVELLCGSEHLVGSIRNKVNDDNTQNLCYYLSFYRFGVICCRLLWKDGWLRSPVYALLHKNDVFVSFSFLFFRLLL